MLTVEDLLARHDFFAELPPDAMQLISGCAKNVHFGPDAFLFREGQPADEFYVLRRGRVALEIHAPTGTVVLDSLEPGDVVGWSWLVPPHRCFDDARAVEPTDAVVLDGACLREKCQRDPALGYALMQRVTRVMVERLNAARTRLLDLYGATATVGAGAGDGGRHP